MLGDPGRGKRFCFKRSSTYTAECQDTGDGSIAIDSSIVIDSSEMKPDSEPIINKGEGQCQFDEGVEISDDGQSYIVTVDVSDFTPKEGGWNFAVALKVLAGESIDDTARDLTVRLLENDVEFYCSAGDGFGHGTDIGCYADEDTPIPPMVYKLQVKVVGVALPLIEGLVYGGDDVCQAIFGDNSIVMDSPESKPSDYTDILMDSPEMKPDSDGSEDHEDTAGSMEGHGNAKCFTENVDNTGQSYTLENIKTSEAGSWEFVFDQNVYPYTLIGITVLDYWSCNNNGLAEGEIKCTTGQTEYPAD